MHISTLISPLELLSLYKSKLSNLVIIDAGNHEQYKKQHLDGAVHLDLNTQLSDIKDNPANGGRHPLPSPEKFIATLSNLGISSKHHIVIYDDKNGANAAARLWWMLKAIGYEKVQVLNGGLQSVEKMEFPINDSEVKLTPIEKINYPNPSWSLPQATMDEVEKASQDASKLIIDVRAKERYNGITEPIDLIAGHIPNAVNIPFSENLNEQGNFKSPEELKKKYTEITKGIDLSQVIVHCGSGVTACHTLLSFAHAGLPIPKLYVGSWSEWSRNEKEMVTQK